MVWTGVLLQRLRQEFVDSYVPFLMEQRKDLEEKRQQAVEDLRVFFFLGGGEVWGGRGPKSISMFFSQCPFK